MLKELLADESTSEVRVLSRDEEKQVALRNSLADSQVSYA
ncbi:MAG: hypothetical protein ACJA0Z_004394 [Halioglobus sp.]|jgi:hypothetical protein